MQNPRPSLVELIVVITNSHFSMLLAMVEIGNVSPMERVFILIIHTYHNHTLFSENKTNTIHFYRKPT